MSKDKESHSFRSLTIQQIEIFLTVAKYLNYSQASKELYLSQPAISSWIMTMEETLGVKLFNRKNRGVELTQEGTELYTKLEHVYQRFRVSVNMIVRNCTRIPKFNVGCLNSDEIIALTGGVVEKFRGLYQNMDIDYEMFSYQELRDRLICGELDAIITMYFDVENQEDIQSKIISSVPYFFVFPQSWDTHLENIDSTLNGKKLILEIHNGEQHALDICQRYGFQPSSIKHVDSYLKISKIIAEGDCFTIGNHDTAKDSHFLPNLSFYPIADSSEPVAVAWYEDNDRLERFLELF